MRIRGGACYLIEDGSPEVAYRLFSELVREFGSGFCISRKHPERLRHRFGPGDVRLAWFAEVPGKDHFSANSIAFLSKTIQRFVQDHGSSGPVLIDGLEYVIIHNGFLPTLLSFVEHLNEFIMGTQAIALIAFRPETLEPRELALLERNVIVLDGKVLKRRMDVEDLTTVLAQITFGPEPREAQAGIGKALNPMPLIHDARVGPMRCPKCGTENAEDIAFCVYCGGALPAGGGAASPIESKRASTAVPASALKPIPPSVRERHPDFVALIGLAFFLLIVGIVFTLNTNLLDDFQRWGNLVLRNGLFVRPPAGIIASGILFVALLGLSNVITSGLRWLLDRNRFGALARILAGGGFLSLAFLTFQYEARFISGQQVVSIWTAVLGSLLIIYIALGLYWVRARRPAPARVAAPPLRE